MCIMGFTLPITLVGTVWPGYEGDISFLEVFFFKSQKCMIFFSVGYAKGCIQS